MNPNSDLADVTGIGGVLYEKLKKEGKVKIKDLSPDDIDKLPTEAQMTIKYLNGERYTRTEINLLLGELRPWLGKVFTDYMITGSYRRGLDSLKDLDIVGILKDVLYFPASKTKIIKTGTFKSKILIYSDSIKRYIPVDILVTTPENWPAAILYFTGSKEFNIKTRIKANEKGFKLNEYGLLHNNKKLKINTENGLLKKIYGKYIEPKDRV